MKWKDKKYKPKYVCCSKATVPILIDDWMYCPKCAKPRPRNWLTKDSVASGWLRWFAWRPIRVAGFWLWLTHYEFCMTLTGVNSSIGGFEYTSIEYTRLITKGGN